ncbi:MAG: Xaa-Pro peptidase family protein [Fimbriimonas sp.]|nr:Xaa-Pro peptidase family protein [Fimbriimonas sp.]
MNSLTGEKLSQAVGLVQAAGCDVWLTFVRETSVSGDPVLDLILDGGLTWQSALMVAKTGEKIAIVGNYDADPLRASGDWDRIVPYVQGIGSPLLDELDRLVSPGGKIAVNFSENDVQSDGLGHGMFLVLQNYLKGSRFEGSLVSAEGILMPLRGVKSPSEVARMRGAIEETDRLFDEIGRFARIGVTELAVFEHVQKSIAERGLGYAWDSTADPIVNSGPHSMIGHGLPSASIALEPGHVFHIDLGVTKDGYSSDIQRCWYVSDGEEIPSDALEAIDAVNGAISAAADILKPGALGHEVDAAARSYLVGRGYPEYLHALGHQVGRTAHDGGAVLGPKWERYGGTPSIPIRAGEVYTLELGVIMASRGYLGLEEMVLVKDDGLEWLTDRQLTLPIVGYS